MERFKKLAHLLPAIGFVVCCAFFPLITAGAAEAPAVPTIEELTKGKVKLGDRIDKTNADLIKEYVSPGVYELIQKGMVMKMGKNPPPEEIVPKFFLEATERNKGQAVMDENRTVYLKDGSLWPGGIPFPDPKNGNEVMANFKYGSTCDDYTFSPPFRLAFINKDGKVYKTGRLAVDQLYMTGRFKVPPLGAIPGQEQIMWKSLAVFADPLDLKGLGQLAIRHYDEVKTADTGFAYLPAFKRIIRVSATTYQDNLGGGDFTFGDPEGLREPHIYWDFKLIATKPMLVPAFKQPVPILGPDLLPHPDGEFTEGSKFPVADWAIVPMHVVDAKPNIPHIYGKKVLQVLGKTYWTMAGQACIDDIYDRQGRLWKANPIFWKKYDVDGDPFVAGAINPMYDVQTDHSTAQWFNFETNAGLQPKNLTLEKMIQRGR